MRDIKFRAWDKELKKIFKVDCLDFSAWWVRCKRPLDAPRENGNAFYGERNSFSNEETDRHILMQYTGLIDKNDNEICEGDIIEVKHPYQNRYYKGEIFYEYGAFEARNFYFSHYINPSDFKEELEYVEIIGNIYENPELLK